MSIKYLAADALAMQLFSKEGKVWGAERKTFEFGPWSINLWLQVNSDVSEKKQCGLWVSISKRLWLYLIVDERSTRVAVLDANEVGITMENYATFGGVSVKETLKQLGSAIKGMFEFTGEEWRKAPGFKVEC